MLFVWFDMFDKNTNQCMWAQYFFSQEIDCLLWTNKVQFPSLWSYGLGPTFYYISKKHKFLKSFHGKFHFKFFIENKRNSLIKSCYHVNGYDIYGSQWKCFKEVSFILFNFKRLYTDRALKGALFWFDKISILFSICWKLFLLLQRQTCANNIIKRWFNL